MTTCYCGDPRCLYNQGKQNSCSMMECQSCKELRTRVAELENENRNILKDFEELRMKALKNEELQNRLFTLLKASEGMEKALEDLRKEFELNENEHRWSLTTINLALADFRAVKENMGKGVGEC